MILLVDDERGRIEPWYEALREAFGDVRVCERVGEALAIMSAEPRPRIDLLVWDLMMPVEAVSEIEAAYGTRTGRVVHSRFRQLYPDKPAVLLTNARDDVLFGQITSASPLDLAGRKRDVTPNRLVELARKLGVARGGNGNHAAAPA